jgi:hypothetical protein
MRPTILFSEIQIVSLEADVAARGTREAFAEGVLEGSFLKTFG